MTPGAVVSLSSLTETMEVQPSSDNILKQEEQAKPLQCRQSERIRQPPVRYGIDEYVEAAVDSIQHHAYFACQIVEPQTMEEALADDCSKEWKQAADVEYASLMQNETWDLVEPPSGRQANGSKWVFKVKCRSDRKVERFKARLAAKGYTQKHLMDYDEMFSPVVKFQLIRVLHEFALQDDLLLPQKDVVTAVINGTLEEDIYIQQPDGFQQGKEHLVCKLKKSLCGLNQLPRCWNKVLTEFSTSVGFVPSSADPCLYLQGDDCPIVVAAYVDDLIIAAKTEEEMQQVKELLQSRFMMKDMAELHYCIGITTIVTITAVIRLRPFQMDIS